MHFKCMEFLTQENNVTIKILDGNSGLYQICWVAQWVVAASLTCKLSVTGSSPIKGSRCFLVVSLPSLLSTRWFQERI